MKAFKYFVLAVCSVLIFSSSSFALSGGLLGTLETLGVTSVDFKSISPCSNQILIKLNECALGLKTYDSGKTLFVATSASTACSSLAALLSNGAIDTINTSLSVVGSAGVSRPISESLISRKDVSRLDFQGSSVDVIALKVRSYTCVMESGYSHNKFDGQLQFYSGIPVIPLEDTVYARAGEVVSLDASTYYDPMGAISGWAWKDVAGRVLAEGKKYEFKAWGMAEELVTLEALGVDGVVASAEVRVINTLIRDLQDQINNIQLVPGPEGPMGPQGPQGPVGPKGDSVAKSPDFKALKTIVDHISLYPPIQLWLRRWATPKAVDN